MRPLGIQTAAFSESRLFWYFPVWSKSPYFCASTQSSVPGNGSVIPKIA